MDKMDIEKEVDKLWVKYLSEMYDDEEMIDFRNITDDREQTKLKLHILRTAYTGFSYLSRKLTDKLEPLLLQSISNSEKQSNEIELEIRNLSEQHSSYSEAMNKIREEISEVRNKYWNEEEERRNCEKFIESLYERFTSRTTDSLSPEEKFEEINNVSTCQSNEEIKKQKKKNTIESFEELKHGILSKSLEKPKIELPLNDPEGHFGWKKVCNQEINLRYNLQVKKKEYFLSKEKKTLETSMETTDDKSSGPGDTGTDLKESLSSNDYFDALTYIVDLDEEYDIKIKKTLLAFWEDKFDGSLDEYVIPGLEYFKDK